MTWAQLQEREAMLRDAVQKGLDREHFDQELESLGRLREWENEPGVNERITELLNGFWNMLPIK